MTMVEKKRVSDPRTFTVEVRQIDHLSDVLNYNPVNANSDISNSPLLRTNFCLPWT